MDSERLQDAVRFACDAHFGQWREGKGPIPYICHPLEVLSILRYVGGVTDEVLMCAAVLHDVVEETPATIENVAGRFGTRVGSLVAELTRLEPADAEIVGLDKDEVWQLRAGMLLEEIKRMGPEAQTIKLCDRISNVREAKHAKSPKKLARYVAQTWRILDIVPKKRNPALWSALEAEALAYGGRP